MNRINKWSISRKRPFKYEPLKIGGIGFLISGGILMLALSTASSSTTLRITLGTFSPYYSPQFVEILTGTSISWKNPTGNLHSITHDACKNGDHCAFDSHALGPNQTFTVDNLPPGHYPYHCTFHPIMRGTLVVQVGGSPNET